MLNATVTKAPVSQPYKRKNRRFTTENENGLEPSILILRLDEEGRPKYSTVTKIKKALKQLGKSVPDDYFGI